MSPLPALSVSGSFQGGCRFLCLDLQEATYVQQTQSPDLGQRMHDSLHDALHKGARKARRPSSLTIIALDAGL